MMLSSVEIFDLESRRATCVLASARHLEAPNWSVDGSTLLVNGEGHLFKIPLATPRLEMVDTGQFNQCNNDHGYSPDGTLIAISDSSKTEDSCIYILPAKGGVPKRITANTPSWWHGWSADGKTLVYTVRRNGEFGIATCDLSGNENLLVSGGGHYDGPDYTPDGNWIWFNSSRDGTMALWRIRADGSALEKMTSGEKDDWFPHPSPDGTHVCFLSYPAGTEGHPFGLDVELRLMPCEGGEPETLTQLYGGQGTINVPSWSPDGTRFAFVRFFSEH